MKNIFRIFNISVLMAVLSLSFIACNRSSADEDDHDEEQITNIVLKLTDTADRTTAEYNTKVNSKTFPNIKLKNGHTYDVTTHFFHEGKDVTSQIVAAKDEHFLVYNFPKTDLVLSRTDEANSTRKDGAKVGLKTTWKVNKTKTEEGGASLILTLFHEPAKVSEDKDKTAWGKVTGGHEDATGMYNIVE
ncbi:hypothetical protein GNY06_08510 [Elizabethkingia argentiflava]|uniref:Lipoprotein n=1 Tax=Elizabethkingia argenteiflava TaxID=2681556 RepID=A0A845PT45_9FLAO|nr:hypothetical protein [Elizabethkingia argenteiflava]NAW51419.1 hypothetical protein [Elizabethkingia argenteiflava]